MFEIGKTYPINNIETLYEGELTILESFDKQQTHWLCIFKFSLNLEDLRRYNANTKWASLQAVIGILKDYWETEEGYIQGYIQGCNTNGQPRIDTYVATNELKNVIVIQNLVIKYANNLDLVEKLGEKLNQKSLPSRN